MNSRECCTASNLLKEEMGNGHSSAVSAKQKSDAEVIAVLMPIYYVKDEVTKQDVDDAQKSWNLVLEDKTQPFLEMKSKNELVSFVLFCSQLLEYCHTLFFIWLCCAVARPFLHLRGHVS